MMENEIVAMSDLHNRFVPALPFPLFLDRSYTSPMRPRSRRLQNRWEPPNLSTPGNERRGDVKPSDAKNTKN